MRISELKKREPFLSIIENTVVSNKKDPIIGLLFRDGNGIYYLNNYLNFITTFPKSNSFFTNLGKEYSIGKNIFKTLVQSLYVFFATNHLTLRLFSEKIKLPFIVKDYIIIGGNHRFRMANEPKGQIYVVLKNGEDTSLIANEIKFRKEFGTISYIPKLISYGHFWFQEEFIYARPINRINEPKIVFNLKMDCYKIHEKELLIRTSKETELLYYVDQVITKMKVKIDDVASSVNKDFITARRNRVFDSLNLLRDQFSCYFDIKIPISLTHGDFQSANILITSKNKPIVIDWEMVSNRFMIYDLFVLSSGIREGSKFVNAFKNYESFMLKHTNLFNSIGKLPSESIKLLLVLEEFSFLVMNDWSVNFFDPGTKTDEFILEFNSSLND